MPLQLKAVIFDFGGVLLRTHNNAPRIKWEDKLGLARGEFENHIFNSDIGLAAQVGQATWEDVWAEAAQKFGLSATDATQAQQDFFAGDALDHDLANYIRRLKKKYTIGLLSNTWHTDGIGLLLQYGVADAFHFAVTSAEIGVMKPDAKIYRAALERAGAKAAETVFVDDFERNIQAARQLGMQAVYFVDPQAARQRLVEFTGVV